MKNNNTVGNHFTLILLAAGVCCFGLILPDSLSDHNKLVHFSAHFGMSFLLTLCAYMVCTLKIRISKPFTYIIIIFTTLFIGAIYKFWEISSEGVLERFSFATSIAITGFMKSMSQNISGLMAAMLLIEGLLERNLAISPLTSANRYSGPGSLQGIRPDSLFRGENQDPPHGVMHPPRIQFSPEAD